MRTMEGRKRGWLADIVIGGIIGGVVGAIGAVNFVIMWGSRAAMRRASSMCSARA